MYLFTRTATLRGNPREVMPFVRDITAVVNERTPFDVSLWRGLFGAPVGTFTWSSLVDSRAVLLAGMADLDADSDYLDLIDRGGEFIATPAEDSLAQVMHTGGGELRRAAPGSIADIAIAQIELGRTTEAIDWSIGMADLVATIIEEPVSLAMTQHGPFGELRWLSTAVDIAEVDRATDALAKDTDYLTKLNAGGELFVPGSGRQMLATRLI